MNITDVRVKLAPDAARTAGARAAAGGEPGRLLAFCSLTLDGCFVVRDLKLIRGEQGPFVAMPSRKITARCEACGGKNPLRANYCGECGAARNANPDADAEPDGRPKLYADIAHPINAACRALLEGAVVAAWEREQALAAAPDYVCRYDECDLGEPAPAPPPPPGVTRRVDGRAGPAAPHRARAAVRTPLTVGRRGEAAGAFGDGL